ncbi:uncharacterized protein [Centruroides vittatus]|uniref:uncharacterized protein n=1 Tax=Centruroides vittatus TaxID=120091 RepID=UPI00350FF19C
MACVTIFCRDGHRHETLASSDFGNTSATFGSILSHMPQNGSHSILLPESCAETTQILSSLKNEDCQFASANNAMQMYRISEDYDITALKDTSRDAIIKLIRFSNLCSIYDFACDKEDKLIQYYCCREFDTSWKLVFRHLDFLRCDEKIIERIVSRPVYETLDEINLIRGIYYWASEKINALGVVFEDKDFFIQMRTVLEPFLPSVRVLALSEEDLNTDIYGKFENILTDLEIQTIRDYMESDKKDKAPECVCKIPKQRKNSDEKWFEYNHRGDPIRDVTISNVTKKSEFVCDVTTQADCFLIQIMLPIRHKEENGIMIDFSGHEDTPDNPIIRNPSLQCNKQGVIELDRPILLKKNSTYRFNAKISDDEKIPEKSVWLDPQICYFCKKGGKQNAKIPNKKVYFHITTYLLNY